MKRFADLFRALDATTSVVHGDAEDPPTTEELTAKFVALAEPVIGERQSRRAIDLAGIVDTIPIGDLTAALIPE